MINWLKRQAVSLAGWITDKAEPFEELTRKLPMSLTDLTYGQRAALFETDLVDRFLLPTGIYTYRVPVNSEPMPIGDQALWHGIATAMWAFKFAVTHAAQDEDRLLEAVSAMRLHFPGPEHWLIRGVDPCGPIEDDASNDTATGPLAGAYFAWLYGPEDVSIRAVEIIVFLARELMAHDYCLVRQDGTPTTYGRLVNGILTEPIRVSLAMAIFYSAYAMTLERQYLAVAERLSRRYRSLLRAPLLKTLWWTHSYEAHRAAIHLTIVADLADAETKECAVEGIENILHLERKAGNSWILALASRHLALSPEQRKIYRGRQLEYEPSTRGPDIQRINSTATEYWKPYGVRFVKWPPVKVLNETPTVRASQALPYHTLASQDFFPQRFPFQADGWQGRIAATGNHSGLDFLVAHWLGVVTGLVEKEE